MLYTYVRYNNNKCIILLFYMYRLCVNLILDARQSYSTYVKI